MWIISIKNNFYAKRISLFYLLFASIHLINLFIYIQTLHLFYDCKLTHEICKDKNSVIYYWTLSSSSISNADAVFENKLNLWSLFMFIQSLEDKINKIRIIGKFN